MEHLSQKLASSNCILIQKCFSFVDMKTIVQSTFLLVFDYGDILYLHAAPSTLKPLDDVYHSALYFITGDLAL